jgi:hypothetical protein
MDFFWCKLPNDIINHILQYDGTITCRNGKYINKIPHLDISYPLILNAMCFHRYRRYISNMSFVTIKIKNTEKVISYIASNNGLIITLFTPMDDICLNYTETILFTTRMK